MRIAVFNWRDLKNPKAGGAELVTHEIAKRWVKWGHEVTLFTASFPKAQSEETIDGVKVVRRGGQLSVHWKAFAYYHQHLRGRVDIVIDEINTLPFFTPLFVKEKKVAYFNQLAREVWFYESVWPISLVGYLLEPIYLQLYKYTPAIVISESTKNDLDKLGIKKASVFPMAIYFEKEQRFLQEKEKELTLIFVGRMVKSKRPEEVIKVSSKLKEKFPNHQVWLVGAGEKGFVEELKALVKSLGVEKNVHFKGFVSQEEKFSLMAKAHLILATSIREGWGLIVTEANALKTPAIVYDVPGLRDAVKDKETGLVVSATPLALANAVEEVWEDISFYQKLQEKAYNWSKELTWEKSASQSLDLISGDLR